MSLGQSLEVTTDARITRVLACGDQYLNEIDRTLGHANLNLLQAEQRAKIRQHHNPEARACIFSGKSNSLDGFPTRYDLALRVVRLDMELFLQRLDPNLDQGLMSASLDLLLGRVYSEKSDDEINFQLGQVRQLRDAERGFNLLYRFYSSRILTLHREVHDFDRSDTCDAYGKILTTAAKGLPEISAEQALRHQQSILEGMLEFRRGQLPGFSACSM
jgi:hypothetical protein